MRMRIGISNRDIKVFITHVNPVAPSYTETQRRLYEENGPGTYITIMQKGPSGRYEIFLAEGCSKLHRDDARSFNKRKGIKCAFKDALSRYNSFSRAERMEIWDRVLGNRVQRSLVVDESFWLADGDVA